MKGRVAAAALVLIAVGTSSFAHRLDEYLQATTLSVGPDRVHAQIRLTPGVAVFPVVLAGIDGDRDGLISAAEQRAYAERVLRDLALTIDGDPVPLRLLSSSAASVLELSEGRGEIVLEVEADLPRRGRSRRLAFENRHARGISAYLVNCLVPGDPGIRITSQTRTFDQSSYELAYVDSRGASDPPASNRWAVAWGWLGAATLALLVRFAWSGRPLLTST